MESALQVSEYGRGHDVTAHPFPFGKNLDQGANRN